MTEQQQKPKMLTLPYAKIKHKMSKAETEIPYNFPMQTATP